MTLGAFSSSPTRRASQIKSDTICHQKKIEFLIFWSNLRLLELEKNCTRGSFVKLVSAGRFLSLYTAARHMSRPPTQTWIIIDGFHQLSFPLVFRVKFCYRLPPVRLLGRTKAEPRRPRLSMHENRPSRCSPGSRESALPRVFIWRRNWATRVRFVKYFWTFAQERLIFCSVLFDRRWHGLLVGLFNTLGNFIFYFD